MSSFRRWIWLGLFCGFGVVGAGWWQVESVPLAVGGAALCAALGRPVSIGLACFLFATAVADGRNVSGTPPDPARPAEVVFRPRGHWQETELGYVLRARAVRYRQGSAIVRWSAPLVVSIDRSSAGEEGLPIAGVLRTKAYIRRSRGARNFGVRSRAGPFRVTVRHRALLELDGSGRTRGLFWSVSGEVRAVVDGALSGRSGAPRRRPDRSAALFRALVLGDPGGLPEPWRPAFRRTGIVHVLAVSGLHVGLVLWLVLRLAGSCGARVRTLAGLAALGGYLLLVGPRPSLVRAAVMGAAALLSLLAERPRAVRPSLALAALALVAWDPAIVRDLGFQLTTAATAAILLASDGLRRLAASTSPLLRTVVASLAAQLGTAPFLLPLTGVTAMWSPVANLVAVPWTALSLAVCWIWLTLGLNATWTGRGWSRAVEACASAPELLAALPPTVLPARLGLPSAVGLAMLVAGIAGLWSARRPMSGAARRTLGAVAAALAIVGCVAGVRSEPRADPELVVLDVGQGDAILLRDGAHAVLVDGGGWRAGDIAASVLAPALAGLGISRVDAVVPTHGDRDHCRGLAELSRLVDVGEVWLPAGGWAARCPARLAARATGPVRLLWRGRSASVGRWRLETLWPRPGVRRGDNEHSLVLLAEANGRRVLLTGDIDAAAERGILSDEGGAERTVDVLKLAHHGSKSSTTEAWLAATSPRLAIASVGYGNPYRHPAAVVVERLERHGVGLLRTDLTGAVRVRFPREGPLAVETAVGDVP